MLNQLCGHLKLAHNLHLTGRALDMYGRPESVSEHTIGMLFILNYLRHKLTNTLTDAEMVEMFSTVLVHDHAEAITGDLLRKTQEQRDSEMRVAESIFKDRPELFEDFKNYEARETKVSKLVKELDILQGTLTIYMYHTEKYIEVGRTYEEEQVLYPVDPNSDSIFAELIRDVRKRMLDKGYFVMKT
jgi:5'-deoxynucleotidase YfbR-like HD superfamily hydrolase